MISKGGGGRLTIGFHFAGQQALLKSPTVAMAQYTIAKEIILHSLGHGLFWAQELKRVNRLLYSITSQALLRLRHKIYFNEWNLNVLAPSLASGVIAVREVIDVAGIGSGVVLNLQKIINTSDFHESRIVVKPGRHGWHVVSKCLKEKPRP